MHRYYRALILCACLTLVAGLAVGAHADHHEKADHHDNAEQHQGHDQHMAGGEMNPEMAAAMEAWTKSMTPGAEHKLLADQVGTYTMTVTTWMDPSAPPMVSEGTAVREMAMGGRVLEEKVSADVMGMPMEGLARTGYDNITGKYWSTWTDNMSTGLTMLEGTMTADSSTWEGMTSDPMAGGRIPMKIETRVEDGKEINTFYMGGPSGEMTKTMEIVYVKK